MPELPADAKPIARGRPRRTVGLSTLRVALGLTQVDVSGRAGWTQSEVSRLEAREDHLVSSLKEYARALGGELAVSIVVNGREYPIPG